MDLGKLSRVTDSANRQYVKVADSEQDKLASLKHIVEDLRDEKITPDQAVKDIQSLIGGTWEPSGPLVKGVVGDIMVDCIFEVSEQGKLPALVAGTDGANVQYVELSDEAEDRLRDTIYDDYRDAFCKAEEDLTAFNYSWDSSRPSEVFMVPGNFSEEENAVFIPSGHYFHISGEFNEIEDLGTSDYAEAIEAFIAKFEDQEPSEETYDDEPEGEFDEYED